MVDQFRDRVFGMLYGIALGDALGHPHELRGSIKLSYYTGTLLHKPQAMTRAGMRQGVVGQASDDTEMTLALLDAILAKGKYDRNAVIRSYQDWANSKPIGIGINTSLLFKGVKTIAGYETRARKRFQEESSQSNGTLMRAAPLALLVDLDDIATFDPVIEDANLTNPNQTNRQANLLYVTMMAMALAGADRDEIKEMITEASPDLTPALQEAVQDALNGTQRDVSTNKGWVAHGLYAAVSAVVTPKELFSESIDRIVRFSGDTDTNGAIAGGILGALFGYSKMNAEQITGENIRIMTEADTLQGTHPRPDKYHPKSIPARVDRLLELFNGS